MANRWISDRCRDTVSFLLGEGINLESFCVAMGVASAVVVIMRCRDKWWRDRDAESISQQNTLEPHLRIEHRPPCRHLIDVREEYRKMKAGKPSEFNVYPRRSCIEVPPVCTCMEIRDHSDRRRDAWIRDSERDDDQKIRTREIACQTDEKLMAVDTECEQSEDEYIQELMCYREIEQDWEDDRTAILELLKVL